MVCALKTDFAQTNFHAARKPSCILYYFNNTPMALFVTDGNGTGLDADFSITGFSIEQPLEEALSVSVTAKPTASERAPQWTSGGGVGG